MKHWMLNGVYLALFVGLPEEQIPRLKHVATVCGVDCFTDATMPRGTLELWQGKNLIAVIDGLQKGDPK